MRSLAAHHARKIFFETVPHWTAVSVRMSNAPRIEQTTLVSSAAFGGSHEDHLIGSDSPLRSGRHRRAGERNGRQDLLRAAGSRVLLIRSLPDRGCKVGLCARRCQAGFGSEAPVAHLLAAGAWAFSQRSAPRVVGFTKAESRCAGGNSTGWQSSLAL